MPSSLSLIRWAGGKGKQLNDLLPLIPPSKIYCEPFGGGASVLLNRSRTEVEVYNDLDHSLVNLFTVIRDSYDLFADRLGWVPYSRTQFEEALVKYDDMTLDAVNQAVMFYTMMGQGISGKRLASKGDWARGRTDNLAARWTDKQAKLYAIRDRLAGVQIECRDALDILQEWDTPSTVFYCDPPYILETRGGKKYYAVEPGDDYHVQLVEVLLQLQGMAVLSGYDHAIYKRLIDNGGWVTDEYGAKASIEVGQTGSKKQGRVEIVYRNPKAMEMGQRVRLPGMEFV